MAEIIEHEMNARLFVFFKRLTTIDLFACAASEPRFILTN